MDWNRYASVYIVFMARCRLLRALPVVCFLLFFPVFSRSEALPAIDVQLLAEVRGATGDPHHNAPLIPAGRIKQGQEIYYTLRIHNPGNRPMTTLSIVQPVPRNTRYVPGSASAAGADVAFSIDGGHSFDRSEKAASSGQYTHIRWQLRYPLAPGAVLLARFRAVFQ